MAACLGILMGMLTHPVKKGPAAFNGRRSLLKRGIFRSSYQGFQEMLRLKVPKYLASKKHPRPPAWMAPCDGVLLKCLEVLAFKGSSLGRFQREKVSTW